MRRVVVFVLVVLGVLVLSSVRLSKGEALPTPAHLIFYVGAAPR